MYGLMMVCMIDSSVLARGESNAMGLYERWELGSLLGFRIGMIFAVFNLLGIVFLLMIRL